MSLSERVDAMAKHLGLSVDVPLVEQVRAIAKELGVKIGDHQPLVEQARKKQDLPYISHAV